MDIRGTTQYMQLTTRDGEHCPCSKTWNGQAFMFGAQLFIGTSLTVYLFNIIATSNIDLIVSILHKIYSMQRILIHIKNNFFVICAPLHPEYAANLVASRGYYHCHWVLLQFHTYTKRHMSCISISYWDFFLHIEKGWAPAIYRWVSARKM